MNSLKIFIYILSKNEGREIELFKLIIPNKFFMSKLTNDRKIFKMINKAFYEFYNIPLYYLAKFNFISYKIFDYFKENFLSECTIGYLVFINEFYLKENKYSKNLCEFMGTDCLSYILKVQFGDDINALEYILNNIINNKQIHDQFRKSLNYYSQNKKDSDIRYLIQSKDSCLVNFRIKPCYPYKMLKEYSFKSYKPNNLRFEHENKFIEEFINTIASDVCLNTLQMLNYKVIENSNYMFKDFFDVYNITEDIHNFKITYTKSQWYYEEDIKNSKNKRFLNEKELCFQNKKLFNFNCELKKEYLFGRRYTFTFEEINRISKEFNEKYLTGEELKILLYDPEYFLEKFENDPSEKHTYFHEVIIRCCIIGSLMYNRKSKFIIYILSRMLDPLFGVVYSPLKRKLYFKKVRTTLDEVIWPIDYDAIILSTLMTSNKRFNKHFDFIANM